MLEEILDEFEGADRRGKAVVPWNLFATTLIALFPRRNYTEKPILSLHVPLPLLQTTRKHPLTRSFEYLFLASPNHPCIFAKFVSELPAKIKGTFLPVCPSRLFQNLCGNILEVVSSGCRPSRTFPKFGNLEKAGLSNP